VEEEAQLFVERIREAMGVPEAPESATALLARGARPLAEWIQALRSIGAGAMANLRTADVDPERLWRVLESPSASATDRAAAAVALASSEEPGRRERIRVAASAIAQPKLRVAVEAASHEDEAALADALASLEIEDVG